MPRGVPELGYRESPDTMERRHPLEIFNNAKFIARYRLDKQFVVDFSQKFAASRFCPVKGLPQGDGIPIVDRVGVFTCYFEFVHQRITFFVKKKCACTFRFVKQMLSILSYKLFFGMFLVFLFFFVFQVCLALRYYATGGNYSLIGDFQGVTRGLVSKAVSEVSSFLYAHQQDFIDFPLEADAQYSNARDFFRNYKQKPGVIGCIDGTHIAIGSPSIDIEYQYVNRKNYHSLNVLVGGK